MMNASNVSTVVPDENIPDAEQRFLAASASALEDAQKFLALAADARESRGVDFGDLEAAQDEILQLRSGLGRAVERRERSLGGLVRNVSRGRR